MFESVFISSVQRAFEQERAAARGAVESFGLRAVMAETVGASPDASRTALLSHVEQADVLVLILASRYGDVGASGRSPTEDEFDRAVSAGRPVLVFVQEAVEREPEQQAFIDRVRGTWEQGLYAPSFTSPADLAVAIVRSLRELTEQQLGGEAAPAAQRAAEELAAGQDPRGRWTQGCLVRVALVPVGGVRLLDPVTLDAPDLEEQFASAVRRHRLISQAAGFEVQITSAGLKGVGTTTRAFAVSTVQLGADGAVMVEADTASEGMLGGGAINHERVITLVAGASGLAQQLWAQIDAGGRIRQVAAALGVPNAAQKVYAMAGVGNSISPMMHGPQQIVAPQPAVIVRRNDVGAARTDEQLITALKRTFADLGAVHPR